MQFADIHIHALYGVDDGAKTVKEAINMLSMSYKDGVRFVCFTPHFNPRFFGDNSQKALDVFNQIKSLAEQRFPDMSLYLANELRFAPNCVSWLEQGLCKTFGNTRYVLVDFSEYEQRSVIIGGINSLLNMGYKPVLAHIERYVNIKSLDDIRLLKSKDVVIQLDAQSPLGGFGWSVKRRSRRYLDERLIDVVSSDAHDTASRPPIISKCYKFISDKYSNRYAKALCLYNALKIMGVSQSERLD